MKRLLLLLSLSLVACEYSKTDPSAQRDASTATKPKPAPSSTVVVPDDLRAAVIAKTVFFNRPDLTPTDPAAVDPCIAGFLADTTRKREAVIDSSVGCLNRRFTSEDTAPLEKKITERYESPIITRDGDLVRVDIGVPAGKPNAPFRGLVTVTSPHWDGSEWKPTEAARFFKKAMTAHPDAKTYQLEIDYPARWSKGEYTYVYDRADDRIKVYTADRAEYYYVTEKLGGDFAKVTSLHWSKLGRENMDKMPKRTVRPK